MRFENGAWGYPFEKMPKSISGAWLVLPRLVSADAIEYATDFLGRHRQTSSDARDLAAFPFPDFGDNKLGKFFRDLLEGLIAD